MNVLKRTCKWMWAVSCALAISAVEAQEVPGTAAAVPDPPVAAAPDEAAAEKGATPFKELIRDPHDGKLDLSRWLLEHRGFLPVPIVISDPAVGYGGGVALAFFRAPEGAAKTRKTADGRDQMIPPDIYGAMALKTENGSDAYGGGAMLHFDEDRWRYTGGVAKASFNLDFYTPGMIFEPVPIGYNADGIASFQKIARRLGEHDLFLGLSWIYMDLDIGFDSESDRGQFDARELSERSSGLGLSLQYDQRDNPFTPNSGWLGSIQGTFYDEALGSDTDFQTYRSHVFTYWPMAGDRLVLGGRLDARWANGDVPFYRLPFIELRGIGSGRYQDRRAAVAETELRFNATPRWALIGFIGAGRAWGRRIDFGDADSAVAKGAGVRYLVARQLGLFSGIDYAWGPEDETFYIQVGSAWH